jgi:hypothetical protein
MIKQLSHLCCR